MKITRNGKAKLSVSGNISSQLGYCVAENGKICKGIQKGHYCEIMIMMLYIDVGYTGSICRIGWKTIPKASPHISQM